MNQRPQTPRVNPTQGVSMTEMLDAISNDLDSIFTRLRELEEKTADVDAIKPLFLPSVTHFKQLRQMARPRAKAFIESRPVSSLD